MPETISQPANHKLDAVIVGAGMSGLYSIYRLRALGLTFRVFEAGSDIGGTWFWNRYPGARCDVQSLDYSFSFSPELEQEWNWSEKFATQPEIFRYLNHVSERFDLRKHITFNTRVTAARWDEAAREWCVETDNGETLAAQFLIMASGALSKPNSPFFSGLDHFGGPIYRTSSWPHEGVDFTGKKVGIVGTGSSGIQAIPVIAQQAEKLVVFQRTAVYSQPAWNSPLDKEVASSHKARYREVREANRRTMFGLIVPDPRECALEAPVEERERLYEERWKSGSLTGLLSTYQDLLSDIEANTTLADFVRGKIRSIVKDPDTARKLSPSFPFGTKRPCLDSGYYETFNEPHVHLVDLCATPIVEITARGVRTTECEYLLDTLVFATGFDAVSGAFLDVDIRGIGGISLREKWADGPRSYLGLVVAGFPNMFTITGPGSPSVFSNMVVSIEQHVDWIADHLQYLRERGLHVSEATLEAEVSWLEHISQVSEATLFPLTDSWYMGANIPGKPRGLLAYIGGVGVYREKCDQVAADSYAGLTMV